jgi:hypothetical protein
MVDFKMRYVIDADGRQAKSELKSVDDHIARMGGSMTSATGMSVSQLNAMGVAAGAAAAGVAAIAVAGIAVGRQLFDLSKQAADFGSEIFDATEKTGLAAEAISAMKFAADQSGSSLEQVTSGIAKFSKTVGAAADGSKQAAANLRDLGIIPQEALSDLDGALAKVMKRIVEAPAGIQQMTLAQKAFGKAGAELLPFLKSFDGDLEGLIKKAKELGVTIDDEAAAAADEFGDQLDTLSAQFTGLGRTIGTAFMPVFLDMAKATSDWAVRNKDEIEQWSNVFAAGTRGVIGDLGRLVSFIQENKQWFDLAGALVTGGLSMYADAAGRAIGGRYAAQQNALPLRGGMAASTGVLGVGGFDSDDGGKSKSNAAADRAAREAERLAQREIAAGIRLEQKNFQTIGEIFAKNQDDLRASFAKGGMTEADFLKEANAAISRYADNIGMSIRQMEMLEDQTKATMTATEQELLKAEQADRRKDAADKGRAEFAENKEFAEKQYVDQVEAGTDAMIRQFEAANKLWQIEQDKLKALEQQNEERREATRIMFQDMLGPDAGPQQSPGGIFQDGIFGSLGIDTMQTEADVVMDIYGRMGAMVGDVTGQMAAGVGSLVENWVLYGTAGPDAMKKMAAAVLGSLAAQATVEAIMELARGFAALANPFTAWQAPLHFKAAAMFGIVAAGSALAGRAIAGDSFSKDSSGSGSGSGGTRTSSSSQNMTPSSRVSDDAYVSGRREDRSVTFLAAAILKLENKISSMRPEDVLSVGAKRSRGLIGRQVVQDIKSNSGIGRAIKVASGDR